MHVGNLELCRGPALRRPDRQPAAAPAAEPELSQPAPARALPAGPLRAAGGVLEPGGDVASLLQRNSPFPTTKESGLFACLNIWEG